MGDVPVTKALADESRAAWGTLVKDLSSAESAKDTSASFLVKSSEVDVPVTKALADESRAAWGTLVKDLSSAESAKDTSASFLGKSAEEDSFAASTEADKLTDSPSMDAIAQVMQK